MISVDKCNIKYITGGQELLDYIEPLWEKLNHYHCQKSIDFKDVFNNFRFIDRKEAIENRINKDIFITLAKDISSNRYVGYIIASVSKDNVGEIDSVYILEEYRGLAIGSKLMGSSIEWIKRQNTNKIIIGVASGNEEVFEFYAKYGFKPKMTILEQL